MAADGLALILWALLLLVLPLNWLLAAAFAAAVHELCHFFALWALGGRAGKLRLSPGGASLQVAGLTPGRELVCALAGPLGALLLVLPYRHFPRIAICALVQSAYNLLPIYPLDGGRAVRCGLAFLPRHLADKLCTGIEWAACAALVAVSAAVFRGIGPVLFALWVILRALGRKFPCIAPKLRVQ